MADGVAEHLGGAATVLFTGRTQATAGLKARHGPSAPADFLVDHSKPTRQNSVFGWGT